MLYYFDNLKKKLVNYKLKLYFNSYTVIKKCFVVITCQSKAGVFPKWAISHKRPQVAMSPQLETYTRNFEVDGNEQKQVLGVFKTSFFFEMKL